jgi:uncharacterized protein (DUF885 family)
MRTWQRKTTLLFLACVLLSGCAAPTTSPNELPKITNPPLLPLSLTVTTSLVAGLENLDFNDQDFDYFVESAHRLWLERDPEYLMLYGQGGWGQLNDLSETYLRETQALEESILALLRKYDLAQLDPEQQLTARAYDWFLEDRVRGQPFLYSDYPVSPTVWGIQNWLVDFFTLYHPLETKDHGSSYLECLTRLPRKIEQLIDGLRNREREGYILPRFLFPQVLPNLEAVANATVTGSPFYQTLAEKITLIDYRPSERDALLKRAAEIIEQSILPAYRQLVNYMEDLQQRAPDVIGIGSLPGGAECYAYLLRHYTTTDWSAQQIHDLGKTELERIHREIRGQFEQMGFPSGESIPNLFAHLTQEGDSYQGKEIVSACRTLIAEAQVKLQEEFDLSRIGPVKIVGDSEKAYSYSLPTYGRTGTFYARDSGLEPEYALSTTVYHETLPGHHLQLSTMQGLWLPSCRKNNVQFEAYVEGWALYAERLVWELGWYEDSPAANLGRLQAEAFRAARLVVDTGIHAFGWTYDRSIDFMVEATGLPHWDMEKEVARYAVAPGQATAYMVGMLKILELRGRARNALGDTFDPIEFHRTLLMQGELPLPVLERVVEDWVQQKLSVLTASCKIQERRELVFRSSRAMVPVLLQPENFALPLIFIPSSFVISYKKPIPGKDQIQHKM